MKIRTILPIVTSLSVFAVPVMAQDAPAAEKKPEQAAEPAKPPADAPAPESAPTTEAAPKAEASTTATVNMGGTVAETKKNSTVSGSSVTSRGGAESDAAATHWKT